jgi:hypothetical protein
MGTRRGPPGCFWAAFLVVGLAAQGMTAWFVIVPAVRARLVYVETRCVVLNKRLQGVGPDTQRPEVHIEYRVEGQVYRTWTYDATNIASNLHQRNQEILDSFVVGQQYPCWYDPADPSKAVLTRRPDGFVLMFLLPMVFVLVGAGGLYYRFRQRPALPQEDVPTPPAEPALAPEAVGRFRSARRWLVGGFFTAGGLGVVLAFALARRGAPHLIMPLAFFAPFVLFSVVALLTGRRFFKELLRSLPSPERRAARQAGIEEAVGRKAEQAEPADDWPTVPKKALSGSPGRTLAVRLPREETGEACMLGCLVPFSAVWIGFVGAFAFPVLKAHGQGRPDWCATLFLVPFLLGALVLVGAVLVLTFRLVVRLLVGRVSVELSTHPLKAGGRYELLAEQSGPLPLRGVRLALECEESATYTAGTSSTTTKREVYSQDLGDPDGALGECVLEVPAGAMHSFEAKNNKVTWKVVVRGRAAGLLPARAAFPVVVYPAEWEGA